MAMRVCAEPGCPTLTTTRRCSTHQAEVEVARGTRQQRGYDEEHMAARAALLPLAYGTRCPLCNQYMYPHHVLHLDHSIPLSIDSTSRGDRMVHMRCNLSRGDGHNE